MIIMRWLVVSALVLGVTLAARLTRAGAETRTGSVRPKDLAVHSLFAEAVGRVEWNERDVLLKLRQFAEWLEIYQAIHQSYPDNWRADILEGESGPPEPEFVYDLQASPQLLSGYWHRYVPLPTGCLEPHCSAYRITAVPDVVGVLTEPTDEQLSAIRERITAGYGTSLSLEGLKAFQEAQLALYHLEPLTATGTRSFFVDQSRVVRHCRGGAGADASDGPVEEDPGPC